MMNSLIHGDGLQDVVYFMFFCHLVCRLVTLVWPAILPMIPTIFHQGALCPSDGPLLRYARACVQLWTYIHQWQLLHISCMLWPHLCSLLRQWHLPVCALELAFESLQNVLTVCPWLYRLWFMGGFPLPVMCGALVPFCMRFGALGTSHLKTQTTKK